MNNNRVKDISRHLFIFVAALALLLNGSFNILVYYSNAESDDLGAKVKAAVAAKKTLVDFERSLFEHPYPKSTEFKGQLEYYATDVPELLLVTQAINADEARESLHKKIKVVDAKLDTEIEARRLKDRKKNVEVENLLTLTLGIDFGLIVIMLSLFILNFKAKKRIEESLRHSQKNLLNSLMSLEERAAKKRIETKSLVHDLKSPIGSIMGYASIMKDEGVTWSGVIEVSERIRKISERSLLLVESLLQDGDEPLQLTHLNLNDLLAEVCARMEILAQEKGQKIYFRKNPAQPSVLGNEFKLEEAFTNIISNAIKFSPKNKEIQVFISDQCSHYKVIVKDQGPGFSSQDKQKAFQFGERLSAKPTGNEASSGIGLFIVKGIMEQHQATIEIVDNDDGPGASIIMSFKKVS